MTNVGLTPESRELDDLIDENLKCPKEELNHEWLKQSDNFYASHKKSTKIIKTAAAILGCSSMVSCGELTYMYLIKASSNLIYLRRSKFVP